MTYKTIEELRADCAKRQAILDQCIREKRGWTVCDIAQDELTDAQFALWEREQELNA